MTTTQVESPVQIMTEESPDQPAPTAELSALYRGFEKELLVPLWTEIGDLMPAHPQSKATPHVWRWDALLPLAEQAGRIVPVGRGGERRAIALANPSLGGKPFATPTLWAAIQYLMPGEDAPEHRHTQHAFRFVVEGEGVWTVVGARPRARWAAATSCPQAGWNWHAHHNATDEPMAWIDGLDIPFQYYTETQFFEFGRERHQRRRSGPRRSARAPSGCGRHPGLRPSCRRRGPRRHPAARLPLGAHRSCPRRPARARGRGLPRRRRARACGGALHQPRRRAGTCCPRSAPRCTACAAAPRPPHAGRSARRSTRCSTARDGHRRRPRRGPSTAATCSSFRPGSRTPCARRRRHRLGLRRARPVPFQRHPDLRGPAAAPRAGRKETTHEARDPPP